ncbi:cytoskeletal protein binding protein, partial [Tulasnella sp. UAMH 9824]
LPADPPGEEFEGHATAVGAARAGEIVAVTLYDFKAERDDELTVMEGETLTILDKEDGGWWKCRNWIGSEGVVPASYLEARTESAGEVDGNVVVEVDADAVRKMQEYAAAAAVKANRLVDESRRKREQVAHEARIRQEQDEVKPIKAGTPRQREEKDYAKEVLLLDVDAMVQASSKSSSSELSKSPVPFDSLLKFERTPADITKITAELKGREVESKVATQRVPPPDPFSDLSSWAAGLPESTFPKKFGKEKSVF